MTQTIEPKKLDMLFPDELEYNFQTTVGMVNYRGMNLCGSKLLSQNHFKLCFVNNEYGKIQVIEETKLTLKRKNK